MSDILDLIGQAIDDCAVSGDALRRAPEDAPSCVGRSLGTQVPVVMTITEAVDRLGALLDIPGAFVHWRLAGDLLSHMVR